MPGPQFRSGSRRRCRLVPSPSARSATLAWPGDGAADRPPADSDPSISSIHWLARIAATGCVAACNRSSSPDTSAGEYRATTMSSSAYRLPISLSKSARSPGSSSTMTIRGRQSSARRVVAHRGHLRAARCCAHSNAAAGRAQPAQENVRFPRRRRPDRDPGDRRGLPRCGRSSARTPFRWPRCPGGRPPCPLCAAADRPPGCRHGSPPPAGSGPGWAYSSGFGVTEGGAVSTYGSRGC